MPELATHPMDAIAGQWHGRPVVGVIDLDALAANIATLRGVIGQDTRLMAVVKANAYGHGAIPIARAALAAGADELAVATVDEAAQLRGAGIVAPILVFGAIGRVEGARAIGLDLELVVADASFAHALAADARMQGRKEDNPLPVHLKVDTGMHRFGATPEQVLGIAQAIAGHPELRLAAAMTHLAASDDPEPAFVMEQTAVFDRCMASLRDAGIEVPAQHIANSAATLRFPELHRNMVRVGIAMYGLQPDALMPLPEPMRPVMTIHGRLVRLIDLEAGDTVGYGRTYRAPSAGRAALVPIGYADGYRRALSSNGWMAVDGEQAPVLGRVSMDQTVIGLPEGFAGEPGTRVTIVGDGTAATTGAPTLDELATLVDTISYEMATGLAQRIPKLYVQDGTVVDVCDLHGARALREPASQAST